MYRTANAVIETVNAVPKPLRQVEKWISETPCSERQKKPLPTDLL